MQNKQITLAIASLAACGIAAADDTPVYTGQEMVVTATRFTQPRQTTPANVTVITAQDIRRSSATSLPELIAQYTGAHVFSLDGTTSHAAIDLRGFGMTGNQNTLVLINGQRINNPDLSAPSWSSIPISAIQRIEVIRGSQAVLYGEGATGGVINIITKAPADSTNGSILASVGSYATHDVQVQANTASGPARMRINAEDYQSDHYRANNREHLKTVDGDFHYTAGNGDVYLKFGADHQDLRLPGTRNVNPATNSNEFLTDPRGTTTPNNFTSQDDARISLGTTQHTALGELAGEFAYRNKSTDAFYDSGQLGTSTSHSQLSSWSATPRLKKEYNLLGYTSTLITGLDLSHWDYDLDNNRTGAPGIGAAATQDNQAIYATNTTLLTTNTRLTAGARVQHVGIDIHDAVNPANRDSRSFTPHAYELEIRHYLSPAMSIYGKAGQSFRIANVNENFNLFTSTATILQPQTSHERQIGVDYAKGGTSLHGDLYHMDLNNEIHYNGLTFSNMNLSPTQRYGMEVSARQAFGPRLTAYGNYTYMVAKFREGVYGGVNVAGNDIPVVPHHIANIGATWTFTPATRLSGNIQYVGRQRFDDDQANKFSKMPAYAVADLKLTHEHNHWLTSVAINNLFDKHYFAYGDYYGLGAYAVYPSPGRNLLLSAAYKF